MSSVTIGNGLDHVRYLADTIGKRPTGFAGEIRAAGTSASSCRCGDAKGWEPRSLRPAAGTSTSAG